MKRKTILLIHAVFILSVMITSCGSTGSDDEVRPTVSEPLSEAASIEFDTSYDDSIDITSELASDTETEKKTEAESGTSEDTGPGDDHQFTIDDPNLELTISEGTEYIEDFQVDNIMHFSDGLPDLYYHLYIPDSYDGSKGYALYIVLPGHGAYYYDGDKSAYNITKEFYAEEAKSYNDEMIIVAPQLEDYDEEMDIPEDEYTIHKPQVIRLTEYLLSTYNINRNRVYISGYSRGGEVMSLVVTDRPELYTAAVHMSSIWRGDPSVVAREHFPVYFVIGESDEAYGSEPVRKTYEEIASVYEQEELNVNEIENLLVLDIKDWDYFTSQGYDNQHLGADLYAYDKTIMGWLLNHK